MSSPTEIRVMNSSVNTQYYLSVREDLLRDFYRFIQSHRNANSYPKPSWGEGISGLATLGLSAIFTQIPCKFPIKDIMAWLRDNQQKYIGFFPNPTLTMEEIEGALERWANESHQLLADGSEIK